MCSSLQSVYIKHTAKKILLSICLVLFSISNLKSETEQIRDIDAVTLLNRVEENLKTRPPLSFDCESVTTYPDRTEKLGEVTKQRYISSFRQDGGRLDIYNLRMETVDGYESPVIETRTIWDGDVLLNRTKIMGDGFKNEPRI